MEEISDYLEIELREKDFGSGVAKILFGINCVGPLNDQWHDFETGMMLYKKYTKSKKFIDLTIKLNYKEVLSADKYELIAIVKRGILKTYDEIKSLNIKDFYLDVFYKNIDDLLSNKEWLNFPEKYKRPPFVFKLEHEQDEVPQELKLSDDSFWRLIRESITESFGCLEDEINLLIHKLSDRDEKDILGFELTLRELIKRSYDYNVLGLLRVIDGHFNDDTLLYFRCRLILYGKEVFYAVLRNPNALNHKLNNDSLAELLLGVADNAFINKYGEETDKELPRDIANELISYNTDNYPMMGIPWKENDFAKRFATLLKLY